MTQERTTEVAAEFLARHGRTDFPHREELLALLAAGVRLERGSTDASAPELLEVYRRRAAHVAALGARGGEQLDPILREDVHRGITELVAALEHGPTTRVRIWSATASDGRSFLVFEDAEAERILTCLKALDQRVRPYEGMSD